MVDQVASDGTLKIGSDERLSERQKTQIVLQALPGSYVQKIAGVDAIRFRDQLIMRKQVTYLGHPWESFKKRIQIPNSWVDAYHQAVYDGLNPRFVGVYKHSDVVVFVDFDPTTYVNRKANNSAAHVATNDLYQAQTLGTFLRVDRRGNRLVSVRGDNFASYLMGSGDPVAAPARCFEEFNATFLREGRLKALDAVREMHLHGWPDTFQAEWPGFYLEYRIDSFLRQLPAPPPITFQKMKRGRADFDLVIDQGRGVPHYGDLKASDIRSRVSPGNDAADIAACVAEHGKFWYVVYEHHTWHARDEGNVATVEWNEWKRSVGFDNGKAYNPLSYASRFKSSVDFVGMKVLEINPINFSLVLGDFNQGRQQDGSARARKVMIAKQSLDNIVVYSEERPSSGGPDGWST